MTNIELVIKIPEEIRLALINNIQLSIDQQSICDSYIKQAIINGTPLSEELEAIKAEMEQERDSYDLSCINTFNVCIGLIDKHIEELNGE